MNYKIFGLICFLVGLKENAFPFLNPLQMQIAWFYGVKNLSNVYFSPFRQLIIYV